MPDTFNIVWIMLDHIESCLFQDSTFVLCGNLHYSAVATSFFFFLLIRRPPTSTLILHSFPTRRSSDLFHVAQSHLTTQPSPSRLTPVHERGVRSEEHTSELQSHSEISYAVFCLKKK